MNNISRAITQAVSRLLPTSVARVRSQVMSCGICGEESGDGASLVRVLRFPLPILIPLTASHTASGAGTIDQCFSTAGPRPSTGRPSSYRKKNLPSRGLTMVESHCNRPISGRCTEWAVSPHPKKLKKGTMCE
jgi:hypothetical protein